jgi:hypothetical protein
MDTDKLVKAIQIIVKEEIKATLPKLVKEAVKIETAKLLKENKQLREAIKSQKPQQPTFMDSEPVITNTTQQQKQFSSNPVINEILNQTQPFNGNQRQSTGAGDEWRTMGFDSTSTHTLGQQNIAQQMGYGDMAMPNQRQGLGVQTGLAGLDRILNRDNSELIKAWDKKKNFRPGMG